MHEEYIDHLMWKCVVAKKIWSKALNWRGLVRKVYIKNMDSMWGSARVFSDAGIRMVWLFTLEASVWTCGWREMK